MTSLSSVRDCRVLPLRVAEGPVGPVVAVRGGRDVPFPVARLYYLYGVPAGQSRGSHAHKALEQLIVAAAGAFDIHLDDGSAQRTVRLDRPDVGLYIPRLIWRELRDFSSGAVCLVLASLPYDEAEYIRDYAEFLTRRRATAADG